MFIVPHIHNLYYDEPAYLDNAKNIAEDTNNCLCLWNQDGECKFCGFSLKSIGFSLILALLFKIFWIGANPAFNLIAVIGSLSTILIFFLTYFLFKKEKIALLSACVLAFYPLHLRWSGSVSAEIFSLFFILLSFCLLFIFLKKKDIISFFALIFTTIFTITIKEENLLILPFIFIPFLLQKSLRKKLLIMFSLFFLIFLPYLMGVLFFHTSSDVLDEGSRYTFWKGGYFFSWTFFKSSFVDNLYFFADPSFTSAITLLFLPVGLYFLFKKEKKIMALLIIAALLSPLLFSAYIGNHLILSEVRHYIISILPIILISCYGMYNTINKFKRTWLLYLLLSLIAISTLFYIPYLTYDKAPILQADEDYETLINGLSIVPEECIILTQESYLLDFYNRNTASIFVPDLKLEGCIFYYEGELCYREEAREKCTQILNNVDMKEIYSNGRHSFYKLEKNSLDLNDVFKN